jgi:hypothetical protein
MARLPLRLFGLSLLFLAITVPGCQAVFQSGILPDAQPFRPGFVRE